MNIFYKSCSAVSMALVLLLLLQTFNVQGQDIHFEKRHFINDHDTLRYAILYPKNYSPTERYPLILFLHGSGARGNDNEKQLKGISKRFTCDFVRQIHRLS
jgi:predicted alpha/beta superfamily hydrolase